MKHELNKLFFLFFEILENKKDLKEGLILLIYSLYIKE